MATDIHRKMSPAPEEPSLNSQVNAVAEPTADMYEEYKEPLYAAPPPLQRMVDAWRMGRKSGSEFHSCRGVRERRQVALLQGEFLQRKTPQKPLGQS